MFQKIELADMVQYIVYKANGIDFFRLFKILYLANLHHLNTYGMPMLACEFHAYPSGPIPMVLFDCLKGYASCDNELMETFGAVVFDTVIPRNVSLAEAPSFGKPVMYYRKSSTGAKAYLDFGRELIRRVKDEVRAESKE